jgi:hypothetical protein
MGEPRIDALRLGVHTAVSLGSDPRSADQSRRLPAWVTRDREPAVRSWMRAASRTGGFLLLVGGSAVGKTRLLFECAKELLAGFRLVLPALGDGDAVNRLTEQVVDSDEALLIWLDELQRFVPGPFLADSDIPVRAAALRTLMDRRAPVVVVGAIWPEYLQALTALTVSDMGIPVLRFPEACDVVDLARRGGGELTLLTFSPEERSRAQAAAASDPIIAAALEARDYNVTESIAGAPVLVARFEQAVGVEAALLAAMADARRVGYNEPLGRDDLAQLSRPYLTEPFDDSAVEQALATLTERRQGVRPLTPVLSQDRRTTVAYELSDYLLWHAMLTRRSIVLPVDLWAEFEALAGSRPDTLVRLTRAADTRLLFSIGEPLLARLATMPDISFWEREHCAKRLAAIAAGRAELPAALARLTETWMQRSVLYARLILAVNGEPALLELADALSRGKSAVHEVLAALLAGRGDLSELRRRAVAGDWYAAAAYIRLCPDPEDADRVAQATYAVYEDDSHLGIPNEVFAAMRARRISGWLSTRWLYPTPDDEEILWVQAGHGSPEAVRTLVDLYQDPARSAELAARDGDAPGRRVVLARVLAARGEIDEAIAVIKPALSFDDYVYLGQESAVSVYCDLLAEMGDIAELDRMTGHAHPVAKTAVATVLARRGDLDALRRRALAGELPAARRLAELAGDDVAALRGELAAGNVFALRPILNLLRSSGDDAKADALERLGVAPDSSWPDTVPVGGVVPDLTERELAERWEFGPAVEWITY